MSPVWPSPRCRALSGLLAVIVGASACAAEQRDISIETVELASGEYYGLSWGGTQVERFHVVARRDSEDGEVVVVSPNHDEPCSLGALGGYGTLQPMNGGEFVLGSPSPARIALFEPSATEGQVRFGFADIDCERIPFEVDEVTPRSIWRLYEPDLMGLRWVVGTFDGTLMFVDPWAQKTDIVARDVTRVQPFQNGLWLIEGGRAVRRDLEGNEIASYGKGVRELLPIGRDGDLVLVDERGLVVRMGGTETVVEDEEPCSVRPVSGFSSRALGYFSPCSSRRFVVRQADGRRFTYLENIESLSVLDGRLVFTIRGAETTALWIVYASSPMKPVLAGELPPFHLESVSSLPDGFMLIVRQDADDTRSLIRVRANATHDEFMFHTERDGIRDLRTFDDAMAILKSDGVLSLRLGNGQELALAEAVREGGFQFVFDGDAAALAYLTDVDEDTGLGNLQLQFLSGRHFDIGSHVREYTEVWWPEPGILYTEGGDGAGIKFAGVDVPCEMTSDAPWACDF